MSEGVRAVSEGRDGSVCVPMYDEATGHLERTLYSCFDQTNGDSNARETMIDSHSFGTASTVSPDQEECVTQVSL